MMDEQQHARDLVAAYVLGATTPAESTLVEGHLANCPLCRTMEHELREVETVLPELAGERTPPPALKLRLMAAIAADVAGARVPVGAEHAAQGASIASVSRQQGNPARTAAQGVGATAPGTHGDPRPWGGRAGEARRRVSLTAPLVALAAAFAVALAGSGVVVWRLLAPGVVPSTVSYHVAGGTIQGSLSYRADSGHLTLDLHGLKPLDGGHVYELWLIRGKQAPVGVSAFHPTSNGNGYVSLSWSNVGTYTTAALTRERAPFSPVPTSPILASATIHA